MPLPAIVTNYVTNPSFETGTGGVSHGTGLTFGAAVGSATAGAATLAITGTTPAQVEAANSVDQVAPLAVVPGDLIHFSAVVTGTGLWARVGLIFRSGSMVLLSTFGARTAITASPRLEHVSAAPELTDNVVVRILFSSSSGGATPANGWQARTDAWMVLRELPDTPPVTLNAVDTVWAGSTLGTFDAFWSGKTLAEFDASPLNH